MVLRRIIGFAVLGFVLAAGYVGWRAFNQIELSKAPAQATSQKPGVIKYPEGAPQLASLKVSPAEELPVPLAEPLNGRVTYNENFTARVSSPVLGRITSLKLLPGDAVKRGEALVTIVSPDLGSAVSDLRKAEADEIRKLAAMNRAKALVDGGVIARKDYESIEADLLQAKAETVRARLRVKNLHIEETNDGQAFVLRSPIAGVITDRQANPGMEVRPDLTNPLFVVSDPTHLWVLIDLPERHLAKIATGHPVGIEVDAYPGERFDGTIAKVGEVVDTASRRVQVRCEVANPLRKLKPEMYARVTLLSDVNKRAIRVPNSSLVTEGLYSYVFIETVPGTFEKRRVALGVQDRDYSYIASGVGLGERIVVSGTMLLNSEMTAAQ
jgi:cobalt-zinc-cadmium efflux system membrane fusion protein